MGEAPQSGSFGCNLEAVETTARQLRDVLAELRQFKNRDDSYAGALASRPIGSALDDFHNDSSDQREKIESSVEALAQMLQGLADGVREVDKALADSLPEPTTSAASGAPA
jgi:uncharacterized protein YukE